MTQKPKKYTALEFRRDPASSKTRARFVQKVRDDPDAKTQGFLHKAVDWKKTRFVGDVPAVKKTLENWKPRTVCGKAAKLPLTAAHFYGSTAGKIALKTALYFKYPCLYFTF